MVYLLKAAFSRNQFSVGPHSMRANDAVPSAQRLGDGLQFQTSSQNWPTPPKWLLLQRLDHMFKRNDLFYIHTCPGNGAQAQTAHMRGKRVSARI